MKATLLLLALTLATVAGAVGGILGTRASVPIALEPAAIDRPAHAATQAPAESTAAFERRMAEMADEVVALREEVAELRVGRDRAPAIDTADATSGPGAELSSAAFAALHREAILQVIAADREAQEQQRGQERAQRELDLTLARAERTAKNFGLSPDEQRSLAEVYALEHAKLEELRASLRAPGFPRTDPDRARAEFEALRLWRQAELASRLGPDLAKKIQAYDPGSNALRRGATGLRGGAGASRGDAAGAARGGGG